MTSQNLHNSSLTQRYQPVEFRPFQDNGDKWAATNTTQTNVPPTVPARGVKRNNPSDCVRTHDTGTRPLNRELNYNPERKKDRLLGMLLLSNPDDKQPHIEYNQQFNQTPDNNSAHEVLRPQDNMNVNTDCNIINQMGNNGHDVNVNRVQSPVRVESKFNSMRWFHGKISREFAEQLLKPRTDGLFLVRESTNFPGDYTLCVCFQNKVEHYRVKYIGRNLTIDDEEIFDNLENLIKHYEEDADGLCTKLIKCLPKDDDLCVIPEQEIELHEPIGKGEFGEVMLGIWKKDGKDEKVAVKMLKDSSPAEAILMKSLHHENLVNLLGVVRKEGQIYLVTEYMSKGSLVDYLRSRGRLHVTKKDQINFAYHTSAGMEYLERMHVVHRDLAARNVLIAEDGVAKVSDFGLARNKEIKMESSKLPIKWTAPEALKRNIFSNKSDMWSFGILLWEIYSFGRVPYPRIPLADVVKVVEKGYRMEAPEGCPPEIYEIMRQSWDLDPEKRPKFEEVKSKLQALRQQTT